MKLRRFTVALALVALVAAVTTATSVARSTSANRASGLPNTCHTFGKGKYVDRQRPAPAGLAAPARSADRRGDPPRAEADELQDRRQDDHLRLLRRLHGGQGLLGRADLHEQRQRATRRSRTCSGIVGTFNSGCAEIIAPIVNRAPGGGIPMVSPANTYTGLTKKSARAG